MKTPRPAVVALTCFLFAGIQLLTARELDLKRMVPVPATEQIPVMDFFRPLALQQPELNLAGTHIAAIVSAGEDRHELLVYDIGTAKIETVGGRSNMDIYRFSWLDDTRLIFGLSTRKQFGLGLLATEVGSLDRPYPILQYDGSYIVSVPLADRLRPLIWTQSDIETYKDQGVAVVDTNVKTGQFVNLYSAAERDQAILDARDSNERHIVSRYPVPTEGITYDYMADKEGRLEYAFNSDKGVLSMWRLEGDRWLKCPVDLEQIDIVGSGDKRGQVVVVAPRNGNHPRPLQFMDPATGRLGDVLMEDKEYDFYGWLYRDPVTHTILGAAYERNGPAMVWFNEGLKKLQSEIEGSFPGVVVRIIGNDKTGKIFLVETFSDRQPLSYYWVNLQTKVVGLLKKSAPWIDPGRMQPMHPIKYKTRDGRHLDAYLTLPAGASKAHPPPLVVLCHDVPWARDVWGFVPEVQFLASRGYAVLQPNYRGALGYNWMFPLEDEWDFVKMHNDVTDATKMLVASGYIDPKRVAIMGSGSFGGCLAVLGMTDEPSLYRCAVTVAGVSDWAEQIHEQKYDQYTDPVFGRLVHKLGDPNREKEKFDAISPIRRVSQIRGPVFVAHGKDDTAVDVAQSRHLVSELDRYHVPHESMFVSEENHVIARFDNRVELYSRIEKFLAENLMSPSAQAH